LLHTQTSKVTAGIDLRGHLCCYFFSDNSQHVSIALPSHAHLLPFLFPVPHHPDPEDDPGGDPPGEESQGSSCVTMLSIAPSGGVIRRMM
jgi:hypothetical protein